MDKETLGRKIIDLIEPITNFHGAELVRVKIIGALLRPTIQIMAERPNATMDLGLCETLSREYSLLLDVEDCIKSEYTLEVSSPGIDRPLTRLKDFERWHGFEAVIDLCEKYEGRRKLKGILKEPIVNADYASEFLVTVQEESGIFSVPFSKISEAKLILSDSLLKATANGERLHGFAYNDDNAAGFFSGDVVMFSIDAVRGLLAKHEGIADEAFRALGFLEQHGIKSLAVRDGQPVMDAVIDAQKILKGV